MFLSTFTRGVFCYAKYSIKGLSDLFVQDINEEIKLSIKFKNMELLNTVKAYTFTGSLLSYMNLHHIKPKSVYMLFESSKVQMANLMDSEVGSSPDKKNIWLVLGESNGLLQLKKEMEIQIIENEGQDNSNNIKLIPSSYGITGSDKYPLSGPSIASFEAELSLKGDRDLDQLFNYISATSKNVDNWSLYAPLISICQSSGSGKSKLTAGLWKQFNCVYTVFRKLGDSGYPASNNLSAMFENSVDNIYSNDFQLSVPAITINIGRNLHLVYAILQDYHDVLRSKLGNEEGNSNMNMADIRRELLDSYYLSRIESSNITNYFEFYNKPSSDDVHLPTLDELVDLIKAVSKQIRELDQDTQDNPIVFIIDEASMLSEQMCRNVDKFRLLRRMVHLLRANCNIVFVTLGTNSDVTDLNPSIGLDSARYLEKNKLLPPFTLPRTWNVLHDSLNLDKIKLTKEFLSCGAALWLLLSYGRPLWSSVKFLEVFPLARIKLANNSLVSGQTYLAAWMIRTGLTASPTSIISTKHLLKSCMATLFHVTSNMERMYVGYPSEPVLAISAKHFAENDDYFEKLLKFVQMQAVDKGRMTEAIVAEICVRAIEKAEKVQINYETEPEELKSLLKARGFLLEPTVTAERRHIVNQPLVGDTFADISRLLCSQFYHVTTVESFVRSLYNSEEFDPFIPALLKGGLVNATHFVPLHRDFPFEDVFGRKTGPHRTAFSARRDCNIVDYALLRNGLLRQCAFIMPSSYYGIDLLVPVCVADSTSSSSSLPELTYIAIQVKATGPNIKEVISKMISRHHYVPQKPVFDGDQSILEQHENWIHRNCLVLEIGLETEETTRRRKKNKAESLEIYSETNSNLKKRGFSSEEMANQLKGDENIARVRESARLKSEYANSYHGKVSYLEEVKAYKDAQIFPCSIYERETRSGGIMDIHFRLKGVDQTDHITMIHTENLISFQHLWGRSSTAHIISIMKNESLPIDDIEAGPYKLVNTVDVANSLINKSDVSFPFVSDTMLRSKNLSALPDPAQQHPDIYKFK